MWRLINTFKERLRPRLEMLYPEHNTDRLLERIALMASRYNYLEERCRKDQPCWDQTSVLLITYGDMLLHPEKKPLFTLHRFLKKHLYYVVTGIHVLPFFPYSSDDGFSVIDYRRVNRELGTWNDITNISRDFRLMVDLVINHVSSHSHWFEDYVGGVAPARDYFIEVDPDTDLSMVVRPRTTPLLTPVETIAGKRWVWTTFSPDQVDLNYKNPDVLLEMLDILLGYVARGAAIIRLDAIAYLWKEIGTPCINLPQTHELVRLLRDVVDNVTPGVLLLTETNLPHEQNISYFGQGDEAHLVYQFSLPPLLLHTLHSGSARHLRQWAAQLEPPPEGCAFLNFTASHDGIGVRPLEGLLHPEEIEQLVATVRACGGLVSCRRGEDGVEQPYELNITYFDALRDPKNPDDEELHVRRFFCSQIIMLGLRGIPAIYFHSLTATANDLEGVKATGQNRAINRRRWQEEELRELLKDHETLTARVFHRYIELLRLRRRQTAFHPDAEQEVLDLPDSLFGIVRIPPHDRVIVCLHNVSPADQEVSMKKLGPFAGRSTLHDLLSGKEFHDTVKLEPYQCCWLT